MGDNPLEESAARANELALAGDDDGAATWRRIYTGRDRARKQDSVWAGQLMAKV